MSITHNIVIPLTIRRLGDADVEDLIITGLKRPVCREDIDRLLNKRYPHRRRAVRAILRSVVDEDIDELNREVEAIAEAGVSEQTRFTMRTSYARGICTLRVLRR